MPSQTLRLNTGLVSSTAFPFTIYVDDVEISKALVDMETLFIEDCATEDISRLSCRFRDASSTINTRAEAIVRAYDDVSNIPIFLGHVRRRRFTPFGPSGRWVNIEAVGLDSLLDRIIIPLETRPAGESTVGRFGYFWGTYARQPFAHDLTFIEAVSASLPAMSVQRVTLRGAIAQILEQSGQTCQFYVDAEGRPHLYAQTEALAGTAPFNVNTANPPGGGNIAPTDLDIIFDDNILNAYYATGSRPAATGWVVDDASIAAYGRREAFFDVPEAYSFSTTQAAARRELADTAEPRLRGWFETVSPNDGWQAGEYLDVTASRNGLTSVYNSRIVKVEHRFLTGTGKRIYKVWFNSTRGRWSTMRGRGAVVLTRPPSGGGGLGSGRVQTAAASISGTVTDDQGKVILSTATDA